MMSVMDPEARARGLIQDHEIVCSPTEGHGAKSQRGVTSHPKDEEIEHQVHVSLGVLFEAKEVEVGERGRLVVPPAADIGRSENPPLELPNLLEICFDLPLRRRPEAGSRGEERLGGLADGIQYARVSSYVGRGSSSSRDANEHRGLVPKRRNGLFSVPPPRLYEWIDALIGLGLASHDADVKVTKALVRIGFSKPLEESLIKTISIAAFVSQRVPTNEDMPLIQVVASALGVANASKDRQSVSKGSQRGERARLETGGGPAFSHFVRDPKRKKDGDVSGEIVERPRIGGPRHLFEEGQSQTNPARSAEEGSTAQRIATGPHGIASATARRMRSSLSTSRKWSRGRDQATRRILPTGV